MIEPMEKIVLFCRQRDKKRLLRLLRDVGALHLIPIDSHGERNTGEIESKLASTEAAVRIAELEPTPTPGSLQSVDAIAARLPRLQREIEDVAKEIDQYTEQLKQQRRFGNLSQNDLDALAGAGLHLSFWRVPWRRKYLFADTDAITIDDRGRKKDLVVAVAADPPLELQQAEALPLRFPKASAAALKQELKLLHSKQSALLNEKRRLAFHLTALKARCRSLTDTLLWHQSLQAAFGDDVLFAVTGWLPEKENASLTHRIDAASFPVAVQSAKPDKTEQPPTLWTPPAIARPINALFRILGTIPGYRENDVSISFMAALPLFCALLIADGGYGLLMVAAALLGLRFASSQKGKEMAQLLLVIGVAAVIWGVMISSFFGFELATQTKDAGGLAPFCYMCASIRIFEGTLSSAEVVNRMMAISFVLGAIHMSLARLWRGLRLLPSLEAMAHLGWAALVWGMLFFTNMLVLDAAPHPWMVPLLIAGAGLVVAFSTPGKKIPLRFAYGLSGLPLGALGVLSDVISYIRLMAVGLASTILGATFNLLAEEMGDTSVVAGAAVFVLGHSLNIALALVALFAHGVRLNMLEFSNHLGMSWTGYAYRPFRFAGKEDL